MTFIVGTLKIRKTFEGRLDPCNSLYSTRDFTDIHYLMRDLRFRLPVERFCVVYLVIQISVIGTNFLSFYGVVFSIARWTRVCSLRDRCIVSYNKLKKFPDKILV